MKNSLYIYGPKIWLIIHKYAINADNNIDLKNNYVELINYINILFPCNICKIHFNEHRKLFLFEKYNNIFKWSYILHDNVNKMYNKKSPNINTLYDYYNNINITILINAIFHTLFTFCSNYNHSDIINFIMIIINLTNDNKFKDILLFSLNTNSDYKYKVIDWLYKVYYDVYISYNIPIDSKNNIISYFDLNIL